MSHNDDPRLAEALAKKVLARAAQLDASERAGVSINELRTAAAEAGISHAALERALEEVRLEDTAVTDAAPLPQKRRAFSRRLVVAIVAVVIVLLSTYVMRRAVPTPIEQQPTGEVIGPR